MPGAAAARRRRWIASGPGSWMAQMAAGGGTPGAVSPGGNLRTVPPAAVATPKVGSLDVEVLDEHGVLLDELAPRLDFIAHQRLEDLVGLERVLHLDLEEGALGGIHGGAPELVLVHLAQALVALDVHAALLAAVG